MSIIKNKKLTLLITIVLMMTIFALVSNVSAITTSVNGYTDLTTAGQTIKVSSSEVAILGININDTVGYGDILFKVSIDFENVSGFTHSDMDNSIAGVTIYADTGASTGSFDGSDVNIGQSVVWNTDTFEVTVTCNTGNANAAIPDDDAGANAGADFFVVISTSASADNGDSFNVSIAENDIQTSEDGSMGSTEVVTNDITVDDVAPSVDGIEYSDTLITDVDVGTFWFNVTFDEPMDTGTDPTITFWTSVATTLTGETPTWVDTTHCNVTYTIADVGVNVSDIDVNVTAALDAAGNTMNYYNDTDALDVDTENPTVSGIAYNDTLVTDADDTHTFWLNITFSEAMDTDDDPTIGFDPSVATTLTGEAFSWPDTTHCNVTYTIADVGVNVSDVDVSVSATVDGRGNSLVAYDDADAFDVDTENPTATDVSYSDSEIIETDVGNLLWVNVTFSEGMNTSALPTFTFSPDVNDTENLTWASGSWDGNTMYNASWTIGDSDSTTLDIDVNVSGAKDGRDNTMVYNNDTDQINIATDNPYFVSAQAVSANSIEVTFSEYVTVANLAGSAFTATGATITEASETGVVITLTTSNSLAIDYTATDFAIAENAVYNNDSNYNLLSEDGSITDGQAPTLNYAVVDADNDGNTNTYIDIYFDEAMDNTTFAAGDFEISDSNVGVESVQSSTTSYVTLKLDDVLSTGSSPLVYVNGTITDTAGNSMVAGSNKTIYSFRISLSTGWNLVSIPGYVNNVPIATLLSDISANVNITYDYDPSGGWTSWEPVGGGDLTALQTGKGHWIKMDSADTLTGNYDIFYGSPPRFPTQTLTGPGWNLIGQYRNYNQTSNTNGALASLNSILSATGEILYHYTASGGFINIYDNSNYNMEPGSGYWLWISDTTTNAGYSPN